MSSKGSDLFWQVSQALQGLPVPWRLRGLRTAHQKSRGWSHPFPELGLNWVTAAAWKRQRLRPTPGRGERAATAFPRFLLAGGTAGALSGNLVLKVGERESRGHSEPC